MSGYFSKLDNLVLKKHRTCLDCLEAVLDYSFILDFKKGKVLYAEMIRIQYKDTLIESHK